MKYDNVKKGIFRKRRNRFIAIVEIDGEEQVCHVKNTGRCKELLTDGVTVMVQRASNPERKTKYDLIAVYKNEMLINIDSQAPNKVVFEWLKNGGLTENIALIKPEYTYKDSRFDFYMETADKKIMLEVKGVTLEENGAAMFPDAPTARGVKHVNELERLAADGFETYIIFVIQMKKMRYFTPNRTTHPEFADALKRAHESGVNIMALECEVGENSLEITGEIDISL